MPARSSSRRLATLVLAAILLALATSPAAAQDGFRVTYDVDRTRPDRARVTGRVANERSDDVFEVSVTAEALDARGKVLGRGITYVDSRIGRGDARPFSVNVPTPPGATSFRAVVSSYRAGFGVQGP
jgi:ABC-type sugar transport system substrate-binding protein